MLKKKVLGFIGFKPRERQFSPDDCFALYIRIWTSSGTVKETASILAAFVPAFERNYVSVEYLNSIAAQLQPSSNEYSSSYVRLCWESNSIITNGKGTPYQFAMDFVVISLDLPCAVVLGRECMASKGSDQYHRPLHDDSRNGILKKRFSWSEKIVKSCLSKSDGSEKPSAEIILKDEGFRKIQDLQEKIGQEEQLFLAQITISAVHRNLGNLQTPMKLSKPTDISRSISEGVSNTVYSDTVPCTVNIPENQHRQAHHFPPEEIATNSSVLSSFTERLFRRGNTTPSSGNSLIQGPTERWRFSHYTAITNYSSRPESPIQNSRQQPLSGNLNSTLSKLPPTKLAQSTTAGRSCTRPECTRREGKSSRPLNICEEHRDETESAAIGTDLILNAGSSLEKESESESKMPYTIQQFLNEPSPQPEPPKADINLPPLTKGKGMAIGGIKIFKPTMSNPEELAAVRANDPKWTWDKVAKKYHRVDSETGSAIWFEHSA